MNPLSQATIEQVLDLAKGQRGLMPAEDAFALEKLIRGISQVRKRLKQLLFEIERFENATGFDFTKESSKRLYQRAR